MSGFLRELQDVYTEAYPAIVDLSSMARGQTNITQDKTSYYKGGLPGGGPDEVMPTYTLPYEAEEESTISKNLLINYITELLEIKGEQTSTEALLDMLIFIKKN
jgi:hypothetical protein